MTCSEKELTRKISFYSNKSLNCISCQMVCKISFCSKFHKVPEKLPEEEAEEGEKGSRTAFCFSNKRKKHPSLTVN